MEIKSGVYCIENTLNKKQYIGSSKNVYKRRNRHFSELKNGKHKNSKLQNSYNKHGKEAFIFYLLEEVFNEKLLIEAEQRLINQFKPEYNINLIANSSLGIKRSEETKEKVRQANLGLKHPEWRNKIKSETQGGNNHWTQKKEFSEVSKNKMSETHKKLYENGYKNPVAKEVIEIDYDGREINKWPSLSQAGNHYEVDAMTIFNIINGKKSRKLKGKIFKHGN